MCLLDTIDGALMMALYTATSLAKDQIAILYYSIVLTVITVVVAIVIGVIQLLTLILNTAEPSGKFWDGVGVVGDHFEIIGKKWPNLIVLTSLVTIWDRGCNLRFLYSIWRYQCTSL